MEWKYEDLQKWIENDCDFEIVNQVVSLDISLNNLIEIPKEIGQLVNLQDFWCNDNKILEIPREIGQLINLQNFNCYYNQINLFL